jgi:mono/diheme cytochrome c family protein
MRLTWFVLIAGALGLLPALNAASPAVDFDRQVRPILSDNCFACHGPDEKQRMAGLHFDTKEGAFAKSGVITPGDSAHSRMYLRVSNPNEAMRMPPPSSGRKLTPQQVETIKNWIDSGAKWETHWAFVPPVQPEVPAVSDEKWPKNPIDRFVSAKLEKEGLHPFAETDRATLLRRVTFDLTGLPPTPAEVDAFLADKSPNAYEKVVDRLLASPRYGERMAMQWLDFSRYAETHGYHIDSAREMWIWRDWVIKAFNNNMPYDQFTTEQIAGDLLPNPTQAQIIATGFNRNHMINFEGGAIPEEYQNEYMVDRIEATSTTWLGITLGCARCHNHKYDPLAQKDFYSFGAFFNNVAEKGLDGYTGNAAPYLQLPSAEQQRYKDTILAAIKARDTELDRAESEWEQRQREMPVSDVTAGLVAEYALDNSLANRLNPDLTAKVLKGKVAYTDGRVGRAADLDEEPQISFGNVGDFSRAKPFTVALWVHPNGPSGMEVLQRYGKSAKDSPGYELALDYLQEKQGCRVIFRFHDGRPDSGIEVKSRDGVPVKAWSRVAVAYDGSGAARGIQIYIDGRNIPIEVVTDRLAADFAVTGELQIGNKDWGTPFKGAISDVRIYDWRLYAGEANQLGLLGPVHSVIQIARDRRSDDQKKWLREYFVSDVGNSAEKQLKTDLTALNLGLEQIDREIPSTMVMKELDKPTMIGDEMVKPRETFILMRGDYRNHGDKVEPNTPSVLPPLPKDAPRNRLTLAKWLVDPRNPLTARVAVNHFWQIYFGLGIVKTSEDFGSQGDPPSNQALLDWLASEFIRQKWDVKAMQKLIVMSATYRQASKVTPELLEKDPENRLLAHGPRVRLSAEMIRDNALAVSGLMNGKIGGPSVLPYQPKGLWEEMAFGGKFSAQTYVQSHGDDLYRRSMYTFWKRTVPAPELNTFDAPDREKCTARRTVTNTPLQALVLLNDPTYIEAARMLAQRDIHQAGPNETDRIRYAFKLATSRDPTPQELDILTKLYRKERAHYDKDKPDAEKLLAIGESKRDEKLDTVDLAAWTLVASTILNMDETVTKN